MQTKTPNTYAHQYSGRNPANTFQNPITSDLPHIDMMTVELLTVSPVSLIGLAVCRRFWGSGSRRVWVHGICDADDSNVVKAKADADALLTDHGLDARMKKCEEDVIAVVVDGAS